MNKQRLSSWRPVLAGLVCGLVIGASPFAYNLPFLDQALFGLGLLLTYTSIGVLIALLPRIGPQWLFGLVVGGLYSLPGSILVAVPYPLQQEAPDYYRNFAAGGAEEFMMTMTFGIVVGLICGLVAPADGKGQHRPSNKPAYTPRKSDVVA
ncbi:MAG TPA: hypothetical protein VKP65_10840 [Rhodothermales bacterium]|nr:hypothetical protein [Rhodothermales bacterium]